MSYDVIVVACNLTPKMECGNERAWIIGYELILLLLLLLLQRISQTILEVFVVDRDYIFVQLWYIMMAPNIAMEM